MIENVIKDVDYFMLLFSIFLLTFAECYEILDVDTSSYGRIRPTLVSSILAAFRSAMGDMALLDMY